MGWSWERSDPVFPSAARRPAIGLVAPTTAQKRASASDRGSLRAKPASVGDIRSAPAQSSRPWGRSPGARCARQTGSLRSHQGWRPGPSGRAKTEVGHGLVVGAQRPGLSERKRGARRSVWWPRRQPRSERQRATGALAGEARVVGDIRALRRSRHGHGADRRARAARDKPGRCAPTRAGDLGRAGAQKLKSVMGWSWERSDPVFPSAARRPAIGLVAPTTAPKRASASDRGSCGRSPRRRGHPGRSSPG